MYNKYLYALGKRPGQLYFHPRAIKRDIENFFQCFTCGGHCSSQCWNLDFYMIEHTYTLINIYLEDAYGFVDLEWSGNAIEWNGEIYTQLDAILYVMLWFEQFLLYEYSDDVENYSLDHEFYLQQQVEKAWELWSKIAFGMWW